MLIEERAQQEHDRYDDHSQQVRSYLAQSTHLDHETAMRTLAAAQVHATLALAAATRHATATHR